jgi:Ca2+-binding EF-hand superfamily protein
MVKSLYEKVTAPEIAHIFRHFDKGNKGYVSKNDFLTTFSSEIREAHT